MAFLSRFATAVKPKDARLSDNNVEGEEVQEEKKIADSEGFASNGEITTPEDPDLSPGELSLEEDAVGGLGRHLGVFSCTLLIVGRVIGTGIFSTPSYILRYTGSVGASFMIWILGLALSFCGLFIWLEFGTMFPRSGGEKVYLEEIYKRPRYLATIVFATNAIILGFTASGCIVFAANILVSAGQTATIWKERGIALAVIFFVTLLHGIAPRAGVFVMNALTVFKIVILVFIVVTGIYVYAPYVVI